ncbi:MAG TPA: hypothetical protein VIB38_08510 [Aestuariivirgaceae bacterium]|jgi:hypothetical protein
MHRLARLMMGVFLAAAAVLGLAKFASAVEYKIPDDCLGDWKHCDRLWIDNFGRFGRHAFRYIPLPPVRGGIDCRAGREILEGQGFDDVRSIECRPPRYTYVARWEGHSLIVRLSAQSGRILNIAID